MRWFKWGFWVVLIALVFAFCHYTLPQRDIVRVTGTEIIRQDFSKWNRIFYAQTDSGNNEGVNRDLRLINTSYPDGSVMVFRNEDTGFGWPWYFKLDSSNLQAEAADKISTRAAPEWVAIKHYGWRNEFLSIYPNAVTIWDVSGPDARIIPWSNIIIYIVLALIMLGFYRLVQRFKRRKIDPAIAQMEQKWDAVEARAAEAGDEMDRARGGVLAWFKKWFGASK
ncbi:MULTISPECIES: DUF1523 family protein [Rhodobacterales]|uniref:DUF1523 family protein n=1 Tax=Roseobacter sp. N2S TaxID=2663844 RepID=UPI00285E6502|nr:MULTISPECIES: DUF1523 family protein [Rhodobacterales]MDR6266442.1 hypothetical protein [Roseobacter sp. N2S]